MYQINDLQFPGGRLFADGVEFKTKKDILDQLIDYHSVDFTEIKNDEACYESLDEFLALSFKTSKEKLDWILEYGEWEIIKAGSLY